VTDARPALRAAERPSVIVDLDLDDDGVLHVVLHNAGNRPATRVRVTFDPVIPVPGGRSIDEIGMFRHLDYLAPGRSIRVPVDHIAAIAARQGPLVVRATAAYRGPGRRYRTIVRHDLRAWLDLPADRRPVARDRRARVRAAGGRLSRTAAGPPRVRAAGAASRARRPVPACAPPGWRVTA
jgi:hypothetical protein